MAVSGRCQGLGVGKKLLRAALDFGENYGYEEMVLGTSDSQQQAIRFYEKNGFAVTKTMFVMHFVVPCRFYRLRRGLRSKED